MQQDEISQINKIRQAGFTLMEIIVATVIFASTLTLMMTLFNYTLKLNRQGQATRQAAQATRSFIEFVTREVANGSIDYSGQIDAAHCPNAAHTYPTAGTAALAVQNRYEGPICLYYSGTNLYISKSGGSAVATVNPDSFYVDYLNFYVRPTTDPYASPYPDSQPFVTIVAKFRVQLPTGEKVIIPYQTSITTDDYGVPH